MISIGAVSLISFPVKKIANLKFMPIPILVFALMVSELMFNKGNLDGEIIHKEIRVETKTIP